MSGTEEAFIKQALDVLRTDPDRLSDNHLVEHFSGTTKLPRRQLKTAIGLARERLRREISLQDDTGLVRYCYSFPAALHLVKQWYRHETDNGLREAWTAAAGIVPEPTGPSGLEQYADEMCHWAAVKLGHNDASHDSSPLPAPADRAGLHLRIVVGPAYRETGDDHA